MPLVGEELEGASGWCLEPHDLVAAKVAAGREKDWYFVEEALRHQLVRPEIVRERLHELPLPAARRRDLVELFDGHVRQVGRRGAGSVQAQPGSGGRVWVRPHKRGGVSVHGYWRGGGHRG